MNIPKTLTDKEKKERIKLAKKIWEEKLKDKNKNISNNELAKKLNINRTILTTILNYTRPEFYLNTEQSPQPPQQEEIEIDKKIESLLSYPYDINNNQEANFVANFIIRMKNYFEENNLNSAEVFYKYKASDAILNAYINTFTKEFENDLENFIKKNKFFNEVLNLFFEKRNVNISFLEKINNNISDIKLKTLINQILKVLKE